MPFKRSMMGFTLIELLVTVVVVAILASGAMPVLHLNVQRAKENDLRSALRQMREAIDAYKKASDEGRISKSMEQTGYPPSLEVLVSGVADQKDPKKRKIRFLRQIPLDPMLPISSDTSSIDPNPKWGLRSYDSDPDSPHEGVDVYDVYSLSQVRGMNGVRYSAW